jgi:hypothetical protein
VDDDLDLSVLTNEDLKRQIAALPVNSDLEQWKIDVMRAELVNQLRSGGGGSDDPLGVREPRGPTHPSDAGAIQIQE